MKTKGEDYWKKHLSEEQYKVLRERGTEAPYSGKYLDHNEEGVYTCAGCGAELFKSDSKFSSSSFNEGWPSFSQLAKKDSVEVKDDFSFGMHRTEVTCANCGGHLGHLFNDGPAEHGGAHYCVSSIALDFVKAEDEDKQANHKRR